MTDDPATAGEEPPEPPTIDVSAALGEAGHEVETLGFEGIPDSGPVLETDEEHGPDVEDTIATDIATRGVG